MEFNTKKCLPIVKKNTPTISTATKHRLKKLKLQRKKINEKISLHEKILSAFLLNKTP